MALKNRFPVEVVNFWIGWPFDLWELGNREADALHHIISPSSNRYVDGHHNESIFNSCPINNFKNHIGQAMHYKEKEDILLERVMTVLVDHDYVPNKNDLMFLKVYDLTSTYNKIKKEEN